MKCAHHVLNLGEPRGNWLKFVRNAINRRLLKNYDSWEVIKVENLMNINEGWIPFTCLYHLIKYSMDIIWKCSSSIRKTVSITQSAYEKMVALKQLPFFLLIEGSLVRVTLSSLDTNECASETIFGMSLFIYLLNDLW